MNKCAVILFCLLPTASVIFTRAMAAEAPASPALSCSIDVLDKLGWRTVANSNDTGFENTGTCEADSVPVFKYNYATENHDKLLFRSQDATQSVTSKCLFSRNYHESVKASVKELTDNTDFKFLPVGKDPRDPFLPPEGTWNTTDASGYDIPLASISESMQSLYEKPFVAECSAAMQIAQLGALTKHYGATTDQMLSVDEVGIGTWRHYAKIPSIAARQSLFVDRKARRKDGLAALAKYGHAAFYGQVGYMRPHKGEKFIDSLDNLGQNYLIVDISDAAVASIKSRKKPLKEYAAMSIDIWKEYRRKQKEGHSMEILRDQMQVELEQADPFFREIDVYVHPLGVQNFAHHVARQFNYNPRTPYVFEVYEDYQQGYFYNRFIEHSMNNCLSNSSQQ